MHEFFHGWRRKLGCVCLLLACVTTAGWIRSHRTLFGIDCDLKSMGIGMWVADESLLLGFCTYDEPFGWGSFGYGSRAGNSFTDLFVDVVWVWSFAGLHLGTSAVFDEPGIFLGAHLAWFTLPLMTLSAWCLFRRPLAAVNRPTLD